MIDLHPMLKENDAFAHLFFVKQGHPEEANIGKKCIYKKPTCTIEKEIFTIGSLQFNYAGVLCYRVYFEGDELGRVAHPSVIEIEN